MDFKHVSPKHEKFFMQSFQNILLFLHVFVCCLSNKTTNGLMSKQKKGTLHIAPATKDIERAQVTLPYYATVNWNVFSHIRAMQLLSCAIESLQVSELCKRTCEKPITQLCMDSMMTSIKNPVWMSFSNSLSLAKIRFKTVLRWQTIFFLNNYKWFKTNELLSREYLCIFLFWKKV